MTPYKTREDIGLAHALLAWMYATVAYLILYSWIICSIYYIFRSRMHGMNCIITVHVKSSRFIWLVMRFSLTREIYVCEYRHSRHDFTWKTFYSRKPAQACLQFLRNSVLKKYVEFQRRKHTVCKVFIFILPVWNLWNTTLSSRSFRRENSRCMRFCHSPLSLILFMLAFAQFLWRQSEYSSLLAGVIST